MFKFIKKFFYKESESTEYHPEGVYFDDYVFNIVPTLDISQPVYAIEKSMIEHPSHWKVTKEIKCKSFSNSTFILQEITYLITDIKTKLSFIYNTSNVEGVLLHGYPNIYYHEGLSWASEEEKDYLCQAVKTMQGKKISRIKSIKQVSLNRERSRLMELYK